MHEFLTRGIVCTDRNLDVYSSCLGASSDVVGGIYHIHTCHVCLITVFAGTNEQAASSRLAS